MLCSNCSADVRPIVAIDIDGTLGDYHGHFLEFGARYLGYDVTEVMLRASLGMYTGTFPFSQYCEDLWGIGLGTYRDIKLAYRQGGMKRTMPIRNGARLLCHRVNEAGAELWMTTTRPYLSLDNVVPDTTWWLNHHEIAFDYMLFDEDKYQQLAERVDNERVVAILDDLPEMYDAAQETFKSGPAILIRTKYNMGVSRPVSDELQMVHREVLRRLDVWEAMHEG
jgi:hypothetical protein